MENKSPLRYPGGKTRACKILEKILIQNFELRNFDIILSPFFGGGSFEFYLQNKYNFKIISNDKFKPLYNFWNICKGEKNELCKILYKNIDTITKEKFVEIRNQIMTEEIILNQAVLFFIINRCSFSGATLSGGFSLQASKKRFTKSSIERINKLDLSNFTISNCDFEDFINKNKDQKILIFLDPPY